MMVDMIIVLDYAKQFTACTACSTSNSSKLKNSVSTYWH